MRQPDLFTLLFNEASSSSWKIHANKRKEKSYTILASQRRHEPSFAYFVLRSLCISSHFFLLFATFASLKIFSRISKHIIFFAKSKSSLSFIFRLAYCIYVCLL